MTQKKDGLLGSLILVTGAIIGACSTLLFMENRPKKAGLVLEDVRQQYAKSGSIENSWIDYDPIEYDLFESNPLVYIGGVTVAVDGKIQQYQFAADIYTGDIIDSFEIK